MAENRSAPTQRLAPTPGQTVGPFFSYGTEYPRMHEVVTPHSPGSVLLGGTVYDGAGEPIPDAMIEIFGADSDGSLPRARGAFRRDDHSFTGFGRSFTDRDGHYEFFTRNPGVRSAGAGEPEADDPGTRNGTPAAPFFATIVFARGLTDKLHTRIYLPDDADALGADPFLATLTAEERATLIARRGADGSLVHDIRLQGERETVFLAF